MEHEAGKSLLSLNPALVFVSSRDFSSIVKFIVVVNICTMIHYQPTILSTHI